MAAATLQCTAVRTMPNEVSRVLPTAFSNGARKLGPPVWLPYFVVEENRSRSQPARAKLPRRF
jgi:hypothetical protein